MELDIETLFEDTHSNEMDDNTKELLNNGVSACIKGSGMADGVKIKSTLTV